MHARKLFIPLVLLASAPTPALSVNKCVDPTTGKVSYQAAPCPTDAKSDTLTIRTVPASTATDSGDDLTRIKEQGKKFEREGRLAEVNRQIERHEGRAQDYRSDMNREMEALRLKKMYANNNAAGAMWEQSISTEMNAVAQKYDSLIRNEQNEVERLRKEADDLRKAESDK